MRKLNIKLTYDMSSPQYWLERSLIDNRIERQIENAQDNLTENYIIIPKENIDKEGIVVKQNENGDIEITESYLKQQETPVETISSTEEKVESTTYENTSLGFSVGMFLVFGLATIFVINSFKF